MVDVKEGLGLLTQLEMAKANPKPIPVQEEQIQMVKLEKLVGPTNMPVNMVSVDQNHCPNFNIGYAMLVFKSDKKPIYPKAGEYLFKFLLQQKD